MKVLCVDTGLQSVVTKTQKLQDPCLKYLNAFACKEAPPHFQHFSLKQIFFSLSYINVCTTYTLPEAWTLDVEVPLLDKFK